MKGNSSQKQEKRLDKKEKESEERITWKGHKPMKKKLIGLRIVGVIQEDTRQANQKQKTKVKREQPAAGLS